MTRVPAARRQAVALDMQRDYYAGSSIRNLAARHEMAFGTIRALLLEVDTVLRPRGGRPGRRPQPKAA